MGDTVTQKECSAEIADLHADARRLRTIAVLLGLLNGAGLTGWLVIAGVV